MISLLFIFCLILICYIYIVSILQKRQLNNLLNRCNLQQEQSSDSSIIGNLSKNKSFLSLKKDLIETGDTPKQAITTIVVIYLIHTLLFCGVSYFLKVNIIAYFVSAIAALITSRINMSYMIKKRIVNANKFSTDILAVLNLMLYSGFSIENSLSKVTADIFQINKVAGVRFRHLNDRIAVVGLESALISFAELWDERMLSRTFIGLASFVKTGGSITSFVSSEMERIAHEREAIIEVKVAKISSKLTLPMVVLIMFPSLGFMLAPAIAGAVAVFSHL